MMIRGMIARVVFVLVFPALSYGIGGSPTFVQEHFRWRSDNGGETGATWNAAADAAITGVVRGANIRLRFALANTSVSYGGTTAPAVDFSTSTSGPWTQVSVVTNGLTAFEMTPSTNFANGAATTALLPGSGTFVAGKMVEHPTNSASGVSYATNQYSNFEFCFHPVAQARGNTTYYFRLSDSSGLYAYSYTRYAQLTMVAGEADEAPVIRSGLTASAGEALPFSYQIKASGSEPITYGAVNLPPGLTLVSGSTITGMPALAGTYSISLTASNAWGTNTQTLSLVVAANHAPVAGSGSSIIVQSGGQGSCYLSATDQDVGQVLTYAISAQPAHGTVYIADSYAYYTPAAGYAGPDSFSWKCNDGKDDSNIATVSVTVTAALPVPQDQTVVLALNTTKDFGASYAGGGGYTCAVVRVTSPSHGTVVVTNGTAFRYVPATNYSGMDSFTWRMSYNGTGATAIVTCRLVVKSDQSTDWPQWRCDEYRSAATIMELPSQLYLQWRHDFRASVAAWRDNPKLERCSWSVVAGKTMYTATGIGDCIAALDTDTGVEKWRFYANGPIRGAPAAIKDGLNAISVFFGSDDGCMYCVNGADGSLRWKRQAGPSGRLVFGNGRLISPWMVRNSGPLVADNRVISAAGFWVSEGLFGYGLDAGTGATVWKNDSLSWSDGIPDVEDVSGAWPIKHIRYKRGGATPVGWLALSPDRQSVYMGCGVEGKASLNAGTGKLQRFQTNANIEFATDMENDGSCVHQYTPAPLIVSGGRTLTQADAAGLGVGSTVGDMLAADNKLFVLTENGSIYCYGGSQVSDPVAYPVENTPLAAVADQWHDNVQHILAATGADDGGAALILGSGSGRLVDEILLQSSRLHVVVVEPDAGKVLALRNKFEAAGLYGRRVAVLEMATDALEMPANSARLILAEDSAAAGSGGGAFVKHVFDLSRPYGGTVWLPTGSDEHQALAAVVATAGLYNASIRRDGGFSVLEKAGAPREEDFHGPMGVQWFGSSSWQQLNGMGYQVVESMGGIIDDHVGSADLYTGLATLGSAVGPRYAGTGHGGGGFLSGITTNPFSGMAETRMAYVASSTCQGSLITNNWILRNGAEMLWYDPVINSGGIFWPAPGLPCLGGEAASATPGAIGNGILYSLRGYGSKGIVYMGLAPEADVENWAFWGEGPSRQLVDDVPVKRLGINFGAPGDRLADDGTLWLEYPLRDTAGLSPNIHLSARGVIATNYHHSSRLISGSKKWVESSNVTGLTNLTLALSQPAVALAAGQIPVIDGALTDSCWDGRRPVMLSDGSMMPGFAWMRYDSTNLYFAMQNQVAGDFHIYLSNREKIGADPHPQHGFAFDGATLYAHFTLGRTGALSQVLGNSICGGNETGSLSAAWAGTVRTGTAFTAEAAIPWSTLEAAGIPRDNLIVNLYGPGNKRLRDLKSGSDYMAPVSPGVACRQFCPLYMDAPKGDFAYPLTCTVRLHFAETEGAQAGQRVFNVKLQGQTVLSGFDICQEAALSAGSGQGGADRAVVKEFQNVPVSSNLVLELVPVVGNTLISGLEVVGAVPRVNQVPVPVIDVSSYGPDAPQTVVLSASRSYDSDGQITVYSWIPAEGEPPVTGPLVLTNLFNVSAVVQLMVTDNDGATAVASATISLNGGTPADFTCRIRAAGGDYTNLSTWQAAIVSDLNTTSSRLFRVTDRGTYVPGDDNRAITFTGGGTGVLRHVNGDNVAYITGCGGSAGAGPLACASGSTLTVGDAGTPIRHAVAECYNDWPAGLRDAVTISGWTSSSNHYVRIVAPQDQRHKGKLFNSDGVTYSGFTLVNATYSGYSLNMNQVYTRAEGIAIHALTGAVRRVGGVAMVNGTWFDKGLVCNAGYDPYHDGVASIKCGSENYIMNTIVMNDRGGNGGIDSSYGAARILNVTVVNGQGAGIRGGRTSTIMRNVISSGNAGGDYVYNNPATEGWPDMSHCASSDGTATGTASRVNQTFRFVSLASNDCHLAANDTGARGWGMSLSDFAPQVITDIDGEIRMGSLDLGADEIPDAGAVDSDGDGIPDDWESANGLNPTVSNAAIDSDGDGVSDPAEYVAGTIPKGPGAAESYFRIEDSWKISTGGFGFSFHGVAGRVYTVSYKDNILDADWLILQQISCVEDGSLIINDSSAQTRRYYRLTVGLQ